MDPLFYLKRICRYILLCMVVVVLLKCLVFPNALDVIILVGLLILLMCSLDGGGCK